MHHRHAEELRGLRLGASEDLQGAAELLCSALMCGADAGLP